VWLGGCWLLGSANVRALIGSSAGESLEF